MREPEASKPHARELGLGRRRLALLLALAPVLIFAVGWVGASFSRSASKLHPTVALAERFIAERDAPPKIGLSS